MKDLDIARKVELKHISKIAEKFGVPAEQVLRYRILKGDEGDKIPAAVKNMRMDFVQTFIKRWMDLQGDITIHLPQNPVGFYHNRLIGRHGIVWIKRYKLDIFECCIPLS